MSEYTTFIPGNNIWKKPARVLALSFERIAILGGHGMVAYLVMNTAFSYKLTFFEVGFVATMIWMAIYAILPAPSNPNSIMFAEVTVRSVKSILYPYLRGGIKVRPLERID